jgi:hypothetical protein
MTAKKFASDPENMNTSETTAQRKEKSKKIKP